MKKYNSRQELSEDIDFLKQITFRFRNYIKICR